MGGHFLTLVRYVERNAKRAALVKKAEDWPWSSVYVRLYGNEEQKRTAQPVAGGGTARITCSGLTTRNRRKKLKISGMRSRGAGRMVRRNGSPGRWRNSDWKTPSATPGALERVPDPLILPYSPLTPLFSPAAYESAYPCHRDVNVSRMSAVISGHCILQCYSRSRQAKCAMSLFLFAGGKFADSGTISTKYPSHSCHAIAQNDRLLVRSNYVLHVGWSSRPKSSSLWTQPPEQHLRFRSRCTIVQLLNSLTHSQKAFPT